MVSPPSTPYVYIEIVFPTLNTHHECLLKQSNLDVKYNTSQSYTLAWNDTIMAGMDQRSYTLTYFSQWSEERQSLICQDFLDHTWCKNDVFYPGSFHRPKRHMTLNFPPRLECPLELVECTLTCVFLMQWSPSLVKRNLDVEYFNLSCHSLEVLVMLAMLFICHFSLHFERPFLVLENLQNWNIENYITTIGNVRFL